MQETTNIAGNTAHIAGSNQHCRKHCAHCRKQPAPHKPNNFTIIAPLCQNTFRFYSNDQASPQHFLQRLPEINFYAKTPKNVPRMLFSAKTSQNISRHPPECFFLQKHLKTSQDIPQNAFSAKTSQNISRHPPECFYPQASTASPEAYRDILPDRWKKNEQDQ